MAFIRFHFLSLFRKHPVISKIPASSTILINKFKEKLSTEISGRFEIKKKKKKVPLSFCRFHAFNLMLELCVIAKHKEEEGEKREDNNQHDDVIFWLNAPVGRREEMKSGMGRALVIR